MLINCIIYVAQYIRMTRIEKNKDIKIVDNDRNILRDVVIYDISLASHGPQEDSIYAYNRFL